MERYICLNCGSPFDRPRPYREPGTGESRQISPCCGHGFEEAVPCQRCGQAVACGQDCCGLCQTCAGAAVERLQIFLRDCTREEREVLNLAFDGVALTEPEKAGSWAA